MADQKYEHHTELRKQKLCPFMIKALNNVKNSSCNWHRNIEILYVTGGSGRTKYGSDDIPISEGDVVIFNSGTLHRPYSESGLCFNYMIIDENFCSENGVGTHGVLFDRCFRSDKTAELCRAVIEANKTYKAAPTAINSAKLRCAVLALLIDISEEHSTASEEGEYPQTPSEQYVKTALEYIGDNYADPISLDGVAGVCGITKYHLAREFKRYTGQTVLTYVNSVRCKKAELCLSDGMTVTEAARECGFESVSYFSRTYKKVMGIAPSSSKKRSGN